MMTIIDNFLNKITMYRLVLYYLIALLIAAFFLALAQVLSINPYSLLLSVAITLSFSLLANWIFARVFEVTTNKESAYISALILSLIITPALATSTLLLLGWASVWAMAVKYILAFHKKHIFNPVAAAMVITAFTIHGAASWWVGTVSLLPIVILGGILVVRKIKRFDMVFYFLLSALAATLYYDLIHERSLLTATKEITLYSPLFFFAFIMLTEPLTTPAQPPAQMIYGAISGLLFAPQAHLGPIYSTPELALVVANVFSYLTSPKARAVLTLQEIKPIGKGIADYVFRSDRPLHFRPGQYLEWTADVPKSDNRGNRRYFTIASSPTEQTVRFGIKFYPNASRFKQVIATLKPGSRIMTTQLSGSFTLPSNSAQKCVFIAGGIGVTPYRSMAKYLADQQKQQDIVLLYSNKTADEIVYQDVFAAAAPYGWRTIYTLTDEAQIPTDWPGEKGMISSEMIKRLIPDYKDRRFYLSGPHGMVTSFEQLLDQMGIAGSHIQTDYFPGFA